MFIRPEGKSKLSELEKKKLEIEAKEFSSSVRLQLKLNDIDNIDIIRLLEQQGILVFQIKGLKSSGFIRILEEEKAIFLNGSEPLGRQYYTATHEYCHILRDLDKVRGIDENLEESGYEIAKMEYFAFKFADYFLMPEKSLLHYLEVLNINDFSLIKIADVFSIQHHFKLSYRQVTRMMNKYDIITDLQREDFNKLSSKENPDELVHATNEAGFDTSLIFPLEESRIPTRFMEYITQNIKNERLTQKKAIYLSNLLGIPSLLSYVQGDDFN
ncbi:ImmA/IrrE family metallo-endopeptidase [Bacillus sp. DJP31]|uniref:ImmA/IrrE family metallo-endopeptidase n=1 Tax=Bacillus sp. DJP31 TaxID=3409789 RepID=UPI003BB6C801